MQNATFYIVEPKSQQASKKGFEEYLLFLTRHFVTQGAKLYLHCNSKQHAEDIAELFWQQDPTQFIAHNLTGEGPSYGTSVEIGYTGVKPHWNRQIVINLAEDKTTFARTFAEVIDFVPCEETPKQLARERYSIYRQAGYTLQTITINYP